MTKDPLITISIPTFNRSSYLFDTLKQIHSEISTCGGADIEVLVSDNASPDDTGSVVTGFIDAGLAIRYIRNDKNIGSDANIAQCYNLASGEYVLILGDDDLFVDGALNYLLNELRDRRYGVVCMRPYGFDKDFRKEYPGNIGGFKTFNDPGAFLKSIGSLVTLISSCVIHKAILKEVNANDYCGENLVQVHLVLQAAIKSQQNAFFSSYMIACKRNNSGGYDFAKVFVENVGKILDLYTEKGLTREAVTAIEKQFIVSYFPFYLFKQRLYNQGDWEKTYLTFNNRYRGRLSFYLWLYPIFKLPRLLGIPWAAAATFLGRTLNGDLLRGVKFVISKI
jgi:glycosyltransferase involved in cell wall biosynthesis